MEAAFFLFFLGIPCSVMAILVPPPFDVSAFDSDFDVPAGAGVDFTGSCLSDLTGSCFSVFVSAGFGASNLSAVVAASFLIFSLPLFYFLLK